jgi:surfeit locus 1 family protein
VHAAALAAPAMAQWPQLNAEADDYRRVQLRGVPLYASTTQALASLDRGIGYWIMTPLCTADGGIVMVNRGFIAAGEGGWKPQAAPAAAPAEACKTAAGPAVTVSGLLRLSEPGGRLRKNEPARNYWYTRDVQAIARARGLPAVAPYFIDADAASAQALGAVDGAAGSVTPAGGLTVISFPNNHLVYAITWYGLALMVAAAFAWVVRDARKGRPH